MFYKRKNKKKREKILAPTTEWLKKQREEEYERLTKKVGHATKNSNGQIQIRVAPGVSIADGQERMQNEPNLSYLHGGFNGLLK